MLPLLLLLLSRLLLLLLLLWVLQFVERLISLHFVVTVVVNSRPAVLPSPRLASRTTHPFPFGILGPCFHFIHFGAGRTFCLSHLCHKQDAVGVERAKDKLAASGVGRGVSGRRRDSESVTAKTQNQRAQENAMKVVLSERKTETEISSTSNCSNDSSGGKKKCAKDTMAKTICSGAKSGERRAQIVVQRKGKESRASN